LSGTNKNFFFLKKKKRKIHFWCPLLLFQSFIFSSEKEELLERRKKHDYMFSGSCLKHGALWKYPGPASAGHQLPRALLPCRPLCNATFAGTLRGQQHVPLLKGPCRPPHLYQAPCPGIQEPLSPPVHTILVLPSFPALPTPATACSPKVFLQDKSLDASPPQPRILSAGHFPQTSLQRPPQPQCTQPEPSPASRAG